MKEAPKKRKTPWLTEKQLREIAARLSENKQVRRSLPDRGRIHIDRQLPFLCLYRRPPNRPDPGTERLIMGEASYLTASGEPALRESVSRLVREVVRTLSPAFGAFLIIEIWASNESDCDEDGRTPRPGFRILTRGRGTPHSTIETLERELGKIRIQKRASEVEVAQTPKVSPPQLAPVLPTGECRELDCHVIGVELRPLYRSPDSGEMYPLLRRQTHRALTLALRRTFFEFSLDQTTHRPPHYHALGRRAMVRAVWEVDRKLAEVSNAFDFLLLVSPTNTDAAWSRFRRSRYTSSPVFHYRPLPFDPPLLKRKLFAIPIERIEDPALARLFSQKRQELDRQITLLQDRRTASFLPGSLQLFGGVDAALGELADRILGSVSPRSREDSKGGYVRAAEFAERARTEIEQYRGRLPGFAARVEIRPDISGLLVSHGCLLVGKEVRIPARRVDALLQHEVGTHLLTYYNGREQPFKQLFSGLAGYEELQEGIAVFGEYLAGGLSRPRLRILAGRVAAIRLLLEGASFIDIFRELYGSNGFESQAAFTVTMRVCRSGGFTKDAIYLRGLKRLLSYLGNGGDFETLFAGKVAADHVPIVQELQWRKILKEAPLKPTYLERADVAERLLLAHEGLTIDQIIERSHV